MGYCLVEETVLRVTACERRLSYGLLPARGDYCGLLLGRRDSIEGYCLLEETVLRLIA